MKIKIYFADGTNMLDTMPKGVSVDQHMRGYAATGIETNEGAKGSWRPLWSVIKVERL